MISTSGDLHRLPRWTYSSLIAALVAGAVCTGVGIGSAFADAAYIRSLKTAPPATAAAIEPEFP